MNKIMNYLRGSARVEIYGEAPERFINRLARREVPFWKFEKAKKGSASVRVPGSYAGMLEELKRGTDCDIKIVKRAGLPQLTGRFKRRRALIAGLLFCLLAVPAMSLFVWDIEVTGNETVSAAEILAVTEKLGVRIGMLGFAIDQESVRSRALSELKDLSWLTVNVKGTRAEIKVRERIKKPDIISDKTPTEVVAARGGIVTALDVLQGQPKVTAGQTVAKGDVLVSSDMPSLGGELRLVHAMGNVYARTWYTLTSEMPLEYAEKVYTGKKSKNNSIILLGKRINLYFSTGFFNTFCDKIIKSERLKLPGGHELPITVNTETYAQYELAYRKIDAVEAEEILKKRLVERLEGLIGDGEKAELNFETSLTDEKITVSLRAECVEQIGELKELSPEAQKERILESDDRKEHERR